MKYYFVVIDVQDGEHEHTYKAVAMGEDAQEVQTRISTEQSYECGGKVHEYSIASFGDDLTAAKAYVSNEVPENHFNILKQYLSEV